MANIGSLFFLLRGEDKQLQVDAKKAGEAAGTTAGLAASKTLGSSFKKGLPSALSAFGTGIAQGMGQQAWRGIEGAINDVVNAIPSLIEKGKEYGLLVDDIADASGASAESASRLAGSLMALGIPTAGLSGNLRILSKQIVDNEDLFRRLGVATRDSGGNLLDTVTILDNVRSRLSGMTDGAEKAALATKLLGRSALDLIDYLNLDNSQAAALGEQLQKMGLIVGEEFRAEAEKAKRETALLDLAFTGLGVTLQAEVGPIIRSVVAGFTRFIVDNMAAIREAIATVAAAFAGLVGGILGADLSGVGTFMDNLGALGGSDPDSGVLGLTAKMGDLDAQIAKNNKTIAAGTQVTKADTSAIDAKSAAIDKQIAAIEKKDAAEQRAYEKSMARLGAELQGQLDLLDAEERRAEMARQDRDLEIELAAAQEDLRKARTSGPGGGVDQAAETEAERRIGEIRARKAALAQQRETDRKRAGIEEAKKYVEDLATLESGVENRKAFATTLAKRRTALESQLAAAKERGDLEAVALISAKLEAVKTTATRNESALRASTRKTELEKTKAELADLKKAITSSIGGGTSQAVKDALAENEKLKADLAALRAQLEGLYSGASGNDIRHGSGGARPPLGKGNGLSEAFNQTYLDWKKTGDEIKAVLVGTDGKSGILGALQSIVDKINELSKLTIPDWLEALFMQGMQPGWKDPGSMGIHRNPDGSWSVDPPVGGGFDVGGRNDSGKANGGLIAAGSSAWVGEAGMERAYSLPGGGTMITPVASGGAGGQPAVIRLEIGGRALMDYVDEQLVYRPRR